MSWEALQIDPKRHTDRVKALAAIRKFGPVTSRKLSTIIGLERTNVTRQLRDLEDDGLIYVSKVAKCPTTGYTVQHYSIIGDEPDPQQELFHQ